MAQKLSLHLNDTSLFHNRNLISHSNRHLPLNFHAASHLNNTIIHSTNQCISSSNHRRFGFLTARVVQNHEFTDEFEEKDKISEGFEEEIEVKELVEQSIWIQMKEIVLFTGPAIGLWLCGPLMSLIDTAVVGQGSSIELAALGIFLIALPFTVKLLKLRNNVWCIWILFSLSRSCYCFL
jgi:hypothetical protein